MYKSLVYVSGMRVVCDVCLVCGVYICGVACVWCMSFLCVSCVCGVF